MSHYFLACCVRFCWSSPPQTGYSLQIELTWHFILRQSFWLSCSTLLPSSFSPRESITRILVHFLIDFFEFPSYYLLASCSLLRSAGLFPNSLSSDFPHLLFAFPWLSACLDFSFYSLFFSLPPQGRSVCATLPECWTLRCWSVHLRNRFIQRWGNKSWFLDQARCYNEAVVQVFWFWFIFITVFNNENQLEL